MGWTLKRIFFFFFFSFFDIQTKYEVYVCILYCLSVCCKTINQICIVLLGLRQTIPIAFPVSFPVSFPIAFPIPNSNSNCSINETQDQEQPHLHVHLHVHLHLHLHDQARQVKLYLAHPNDMSSSF